MIPGVKLIVLGKQGAGKGTQCSRLARHYVVQHISTGDMFRMAKASGTEFGRKLDEYMSKGLLVPDDVVLGVVKERLAQRDVQERGFILDGFPRTVHQADGLTKILEPDELELAIDLELPTELAMERLATRLVCESCNAIYSDAAPPAVDHVCDNCGGEVSRRNDDNEDAIRQRLALYEKETEPLISFYLERDKLVTVDAVGSPDEVTARRVRAIDRRRGRL